MIKKRMYGVKVLRQTVVDGNVVTPGIYHIAGDMKQVNAAKLIEVGKAVEIEKSAPPEPAPEPEVEKNEAPAVADVKNREDTAPPVKRRGRPKTTRRKLKK